tara:strand:+ start:433 stop:1035 length:603 start_codon:yes stop_codon:yes gene_type:complete
MNLLKNLKVCKVNIEKSSLAKTLEKVYGIEWGFSQETPLDSYHHLRACLIKDITIEPGEVLPVPTGMYLQLLSPNFIVEVGTDHDLAYNEGLTIFDSPMLFSYTFRNEIWLLIKNNFKEVQTIHPTKKLATFSIRQLPQMVINYVDQIEESNLNFRTSKKFIQDIKKKISPDIYDIKKQRLSQFYSREEIDNYIRSHNGS